MAAPLDPRAENLDQELDCAEYYGSETEDSETGTDTISWISWFCSYEGHEYFVEVPEDYIDDEFNLTGLRQIVPHYTQAIHMILDLEDDFDEGNWDGTTKPDIQDIEDSAERLYGLIHARYIITRQGLHQMAEKYVAGQFGSCPRYHCKNTFVLPCGLSDSPNFDAVKLFCPNCKDLYSPASTRFSTVDGAYFGTTFPHMFFLTFPEYLVNGQIGDKYIARIYGFK
ncbi:casein kinase 2 regulatory subunit, partial [Dimargaris verticillata]